MGSIVANVADAETEYHAHEFIDVTLQPKPVYISPNEIYAMHGILTQNVEQVVSYELFGGADLTFIF
jgi:Ras GTPase-activating-like protein IQGAP2/3